MDKLQKEVILILKSALTGEKYTLPDDFDIEGVYKTALKHSVVSMMYYGMINCGVNDSSPQMQQLFMKTCQNIVTCEKQMYELKRLFEAFDNEKIEYMPVKGVLIKNMFPKPEMRSMGDADILIKIEQYDKIKAVMEKLDFKEVLESDHELNWVKRGSLFVELHKRLIPSYNKDYFAYYGDGWRLAKLCDGTRYSMTDEDQMIYLFTHFAKHYRTAGIGIRHFVDIWVYRKNKPELDEEYIMEELKKLQIDKFYLNVIDTLSAWFDNGENTEITDHITKVVFNSGLYGTHEANVLSEAAKISKTVENSDDVKGKRALYLLFLPYEHMCKKYPVLKKAPFLLPIMWVVRAFDVVLFKRHKIKKDSKDLKLMTSENINSYLESLNYVGLDFNFKE